jgi:DNA helicase-4
MQPLEMTTHDNPAAWLARYAQLFDSIESTPLTQEQRLAAISDAPATLVLAGAGTGKTSTLTGRVAFLLAHGLAKPSEILCLAFAREAAREIEDRLQRRLAARWAVQGFSASTFHSLGLRIVREVEGNTPVLTELCRNRQKLAVFIHEQMLQLSTQSVAYACVLFEYFSMIEPGLALSCEFAERSSYQAECSIRLLQTIRGDVVRYPFDCLVANALCLMGIDYDYRRHYPYPVFLARRRPYQSTFYLPEADVYVDVFDCTRQASEQCAAATLSRRLSRWHQHHGTRHIILWEAPGYTQDIWLLIAQLSRKLIECGISAGTVRMDATHSSMQNDQVPNIQGRAGRYRACLQPLVGSARWYSLVDVLATVLPLHLQWQAQRVTNTKHTERKHAWERRRIANITALVQPLATAYKARLHTHGEIDFDDMICRATQYVATGRFVVPWRDILIDEFQDISLPRFALIAAMLRQRPDLRLFCVGDDWQAIYRFAGSEIRYCTQFSDYVHPQARVVLLSCTFRFNQALCNVSSQFLMKNPFQNRKLLFAASNDMRPVVTVARQEDGLAVILSRLQRRVEQGAEADHDCGYVSKTFVQRFGATSLMPKAGFRIVNWIAAPTAFALPVLARILPAAAVAAAEPVDSSASTTTPMSTDACHGRSLSTPKASVLILARFAHLLPDDGRLDAYAGRYPGLQFSASTVHAAKGLEADYVLILNMEQGVYGFPSGRPSDLVIERFVPQPECFEHADERRLFYVALTRARKHVWLLVPQDQKKMSVFVRELLQDNKTVVRGVGKRGATERACQAGVGRPGSASKIAVKMACGVKSGWRLHAHDTTLADWQKRPIACVVDKIKRCIIGIGVGTEKKNRII